MIILNNLIIIKISKSNIFSPFLIPFVGGVINLFLKFEKLYSDFHKIAQLKVYQIIYIKWRPRRRRRAAPPLRRHDERRPTQHGFIL